MRVHVVHLKRLVVRNTALRLAAMARDGLTDVSFVVLSLAAGELSDLNGHPIELNGLDISSLCQGLLAGRWMTATDVTPNFAANHFPSAYLGDMIAFVDGSLDIQNAHIERLAFVTSLQRDGGKVYPLVTDLNRPSCSITLNPCSPNLLLTDYPGMSAYLCHFSALEQ